MTLELLCQEYLKLLCQEYLDLMRLFFSVVDSIRGINIDSDNRWLLEANPLYEKLFKHIGTIYHLYNGISLKIFDNVPPKGYVDHSSIAVITRAAFETYLAFYYIYCDSTVPVEEKRFRHLVWKIGGLLDWQKFAIVAKSQENRQKLVEVKSQLEDLLGRIKSTTIYSDLNSKGRKAARDGKWRHGRTWAECAEIAGFHKEGFKDVYSYLCSYAHSGSLSVMQIWQAVNIEDQQGLTNIHLHYGMILMSHFIFSFSELFDNAEIAFGKDEKLKDLATRWHITWKEEEFLRPFNSDRLKY